MEKLQRNIKAQLIFMWLHLLAMYVPFCIFMFNQHYVSTISLSVIGWFLGYLHLLILYLILGLPALLYQLFFLNRNFAGNHRWIYIASTISCVLIIIGSLIPLRWGEQYRFLYFAHEIVSVSSTIVFMLIMWITLILCARKSKHKVFLLSLCAIFPIVLVVAFMILWTAALFQLSATLSFLLILTCANTATAKKTL
jgi:hypothetical protein